MKAERIDKLLVEAGLADSRTKAKALVMAGLVLVDDRRVNKPSETFPPDRNIRLKGDSPENRYVGRGGLKLEKALDGFGIDPDGSVCIDVGSSTGGFTDCLLSRGAKRVYAIDAGTNQLDWKLRSDDRVVVMENTNARYLQVSSIPELADLVTMDVSFISVTKLLRPVLNLLKPDGSIVILVKPQFEVGKGEVGKGGIVRDEEKRLGALETVASFARSLDLVVIGQMESPIRGAEGNLEYLLYLERAA